MTKLNGPQTTGRDYRNLSEPRYGSRSDLNTEIAVRDGTTLLADVHRPDADGRLSLSAPDAGPGPPRPDSSRPG
ncbi:hypothetical protein [Mycobacterium servetii]|uniref:Uncharacterized protein n=1 Tax=Mycobacterium servetii TaxID=3237418 RepID=A0ABV4BW23_9MYCO